MDKLEAWLVAVDKGSDNAQQLEFVAGLVQQDAVALATLVRAGALSQVAARHDPRNGWAAQILVAASEEYAHQVVEAQALPVLVAAVGMAQLEEDAAWALGNLSAHADVAEPMIADKALGACLAVLATAQTNLSKCFAASTLANLAVDERGKAAIGSMGGVEALLDALATAEVDTAAQMTRCLANLLLDDSCRNRLVAHAQGLPLLLQQVSGPDDALQESAVRAIANVAFDPEQAKAVFATGAVGSVVGLLASPSVRVQLQALCALRNLTADPPAALEVVSHGAIPPLATLLRSESEQVQVQAVWVIGALAMHEGANLQLVSAGVLPVLEELKYSSDPEAKDAASQALGNLARILTPNSRRVIQQDTLQLDRGGRALGMGGGKPRRQSPLANGANASVAWKSPKASAVWKSPLGGTSGGGSSAAPMDH